MNQKKQTNRFQEAYNEKYFWLIKLWKSFQKGEAVLEPKRASVLESFCGYT